MRSPTQFAVADIQPHQVHEVSQCFRDIPYNRIVVPTAKYSEKTTRRGLDEIDRWGQKSVKETQRDTRRERNHGGLTKLQEGRAGVISSATTFSLPCGLIQTKKRGVEMRPPVVVHSPFVETNLLRDKLWMERGFERQYSNAHRMTPGWFNVGMVT